MTESMVRDEKRGTDGAVHAVVSRPVASCRVESGRARLDIVRCVRVNELGE